MNAERSNASNGQWAGKGEGRSKKKAGRCKRHCAGRGKRGRVGLTPSSVGALCVMQKTNYSVLPMWLDLWPKKESKVKPGGSQKVASLVGRSRLGGKTHEHRRGLG